MQIIDISQPVTTKTACFPGDTPFSFSLQASHATNESYNLTAFRMSPHVGTHTDAPLHVLNSTDSSYAVGNLPLEPFIGPCIIIDLSPWTKEIQVRDIQSKLDACQFPERVLFKTKAQNHFTKFDKENAFLSVEIIHFLHSKNVKLIGIDTPSVDPIKSKTLDAHKTLIDNQMVWLENLNLTEAKETSYFLSALPIKLMELEASPVRAVLLALNTSIP